jgi:hypothetical protein
MSKMLGRKYGKLLVIGQVDGRRIQCMCDCGKEITAWWANLIQGKKTHCGCGKYADRDITGKRYGRWAVIGKCNGSVEYWECRCDCGNDGVVSRCNLLRGWSQSCGCLQKERVKEVGEKNKRFTDEEMRLRGIRPNIRSWRKAVIQRDGGECVICGVSGELIAHHKDSWIISVEGRRDVDNSTTVCRVHHEEFHNKYGKGSNTNEDWLKYVEEKIGDLSIRTQQT